MWVVKRWRWCVGWWEGSQAACGGHGMAWRDVKKVRDGWWGFMCVVLQAVKQNGEALSHASEELQNNPEIVLEVCVGTGIAWW